MTKIHLKIEIIDILTAHDRAAITGAMQEHLIRSIDAWISVAQADAIDPEDEAIAAHLADNQDAQWDFMDELQGDADFDFGDCDGNEWDIVPAPQNRHPRSETTTPEDTHPSP